MNMNMPSPESERATPQITQEEFDTYLSSTDKSLDDPELIQWMSEKGLSFDQGERDILVNGKPARIVTARNDFGTQVDQSRLPPSPETRQ